MSDDERPALVGVLLKVLGVAVGIGLAIGLVVLVLAKALGLGGASTSGSTDQPLPNAPLSSLPTAALTPSGSPSADPSTQGPSATPTKQAKQIQLSVSPALARPSERINLSGTFLGRGNAVLQVQRKEGGRWTPFAGVKATVSGGSFATYVLTSRTGKNLFRVYDPGSKTASNPVTVTVR